jgi:hypothetical protein
MLITAMTKGLCMPSREVRLLAPWAYALYAADGDWWDNLYKKHGGAADFKGRRITVNEEAAKRYGLECYKYKTNIPWSDKAGLIATGGNSGFQVANIAALEGAERLILLGFDMGQSVPNKHFWTGQFDRGVPLRDSDFPRWLEAFAKAAPLIPVPVINCTVGGNLEAFPRARLRDVL